ncbi:MAG: SPOR domain-containing protein, partial [Alphaproteobacteria bacterium]|nr:SPOR domain-containing protein [Alphaproteobacteria bacterium]
LIGSAAAATRAPPPPDMGTGVFVHAGSFRSPERAERLRSRLAALGEARVVPARSGEAGTWRVRIGPLATPEVAERVMDQAVAIAQADARTAID